MVTVITTLSMMADAANAVPKLKIRVWQHESHLKPLCCQRDLIT
jgi:hypothetical protein